VKGLFITATDTEVGKTVITGAIAAAIKARSITVGVLKPMASGGVVANNGTLQAEDVVFLMKAARMGENQCSLVNSITLAPALTPAVAAVQSGIVINISEVIANCRAAGQQFETVLVEGVGGITAPLWEDYLVADMIEELGLPVVIVTSLKLGTINHTVLTAAYAKQRGFNVAGIVVNRWNEEEAGILENSNIEYIKRLTGLPILGKFPVVPFVSVPEGKIGALADFAERYLDIEQLLNLMKGGTDSG
jgi:dethiobiotin synthetase